MTTDHNSFLAAIEEKYANVAHQIMTEAHQLHASVNQFYDNTLPYSFHLDSVVDYVTKYSHEVCAHEAHIIPILFGAYFHDSLEDTRISYNDLTKIALKHMDKDQAFIAAEIVFALTNDKGRTRAERAGEKYYQGIRQTPYAAFVKLADRLANASYSCGLACNNYNQRMKDVYCSEFPHFIESITPTSPGPQFHLPQQMIAELQSILNP